MVKGYLESVKKYRFLLSQLVSRDFKTRYKRSVLGVLWSMLNPLLIIFLQGMSLNWYHLLIPVLYVALILFSCGIGLILSAMMVYFRDTQFLYGVIIVLWMYLTPLFYPVDIIPDNLMGIYSLNPMYQYVTFFRTLVLDGTLPTLAQFAWCFGYAAVFMLIGFALFKKLKRNFILYI